MILCIQLSNFLEPLSLLFTDDITVAESPFTIRLDIYEAFAYIKLSNKAKICLNGQPHFCMLRESSQYHTRMIFNHSSNTYLSQIQAYLLNICQSSNLLILLGGVNQSIIAFFKLIEEQAPFQFSIKR